MRHFFFRLMNMLIGLVLFALGIITTVKANIGFSPWDVFHAGLSETLGLSFGITSIIVGMVILVIIVLLGEKIGLGTIVNIIVIGIIIDIIFFMDVLPTPENLVLGILMLILGLFSISIGSYFYIGSGFGTGPRDGLMVVLTKRTKLPVGICRSAVELTVTLAGWLLGGMVGIGTLISVIGIGFCIQITFRIMRFDITKIEHESLRDTFKALAKMKNNQ